MREISLITGQLHRAIYNLNDEARRTANQKFEKGLTSAPERSLKKAFGQFRESLEKGDSIVRRRTASLLVTLIRSFDRITPALQPEILQLIDTGLLDTNPLVREATVESYSLLLEKVGDQMQLADASASPEQPSRPTQQRQERDQGPPQTPDSNPAEVALRRILECALADPHEIVREAAIVSVAVQKSAAVQSFSISFLIAQVNDRRHRRACRSVESLAEFPTHQSAYLHLLKDTLNHGNWRFRRSALKSALRLAKLESLPPVLLPNVTRRLFDANSKVASAAQEVVKTARATIERRDQTTAEFLTESLWLAHQTDPENHLQAIWETRLVQDNLALCIGFCNDRTAWRNRCKTVDHNSSNTAAGATAGLAKTSTTAALIASADRLMHSNPRSSIGWIAGTLMRLKIP